MLKLIIEMSPSIINKIFFSVVLPMNFFKTINYIETKALLKTDLIKGVKLVICDIHMKPGFTIEDFKLQKGYTLHVLEKEHNRYTCLMKIKYTKSMVTILSRFNMEDISPDLPVTLSKEKMVLSFIGEEESIGRLLKILKTLGPLKVISIQTTVISEFNILSCLTKKQREILLLAKKMGYYEIPRKITTEKLAEKIGISKATAIEHMRKAENKIMSTLLAGY